MYMPFKHKLNYWELYKINQTDNAHVVRKGQALLSSAQEQIVVGVKYFKTSFLCLEQATASTEKYKDVLRSPLCTCKRE